ncbi:CehA/McbA family metallohydrolase [Paenibacillus sp. 22594]|uniref:CehA/McbA family metallohydrolase n=1 Tax=Paenibacillus sp. 22594 TaxID=3453947 RepID=UPI003F87A5E3
MKETLICTEVREASLLPGPSVLAYTFSMKEPMDWISLAISYEELNWLQIFVKDPDGFIRMQYTGNKQSERILLGRLQENCSVGSVPGDIRAGTWKTEMIAYARDEEGVLKLEWKHGKGVSAESSTLPIAIGTPWVTLNGNDRYEQEPINRSTGWYKGDFHMHTSLSDGKQSPEQLMQSSLRQQLDFIVVTEHNHRHTAWPSHDRLLALPGMEVTAFQGHWNVLGIMDWLPLYDEDGTLTIEDAEGMNRIIAAAREQGAVCSLNHPYLAPWDWRFGRTEMSLFHAIEIWNDPTYEGNAEAAERALKLWDACWGRGLRLTGIGGSDTHLLPHESYMEGGPPSLAGDPATYVYCDELSGDQLLAAVKKGRCIVSRGPVLEPCIYSGGRKVLPGDQVVIHAQSAVPIRYSIAIKGMKEKGKMIWLLNGLNVFEADVNADRPYVYETEWAGDIYRWLRVELRSEYGTLLAFINPIYANPIGCASLTWEEVNAEL